MKILAIGATGFIGSRVARQLLMQGHQVVLFHRGNTTASELDSIVHLYGTRNELPNFKAEFERFAPMLFSTLSLIQKHKHRMLFKCSAAALSASLPLVVGMYTATMKVFTVKGAIPLIHLP